MAPKKDKTGDNISQSSTETTSVYPIPKIILINLPDPISTRLLKANFNVVRGTFGNPYKVEATSRLSPVIRKPDLPNYDEQDIVIIDLVPLEILDNPLGKKLIPNDETDYWTKCSYGLIDPRPLSMRTLMESSDRILDHGGGFIIFASSQIEWDIKRGYVTRDFHESGSSVNVSDWDLLNCIIRGLHIENQTGEETRIIDEGSPLSKVLKKYNKNFNYQATFTCINPSYYEFNPIVLNKYDSVIGACFRPKKSKGWVIILPQISDKSDLIYDLITQVLPDLIPEKFPYFIQNKWINNEEYDLKSVSELKKEITKISSEFQQRVQKLNDQVAQEQDKFKFLYGLLIKSGPELVECVKQTLTFIGFKDIRDVDKSIEAKGNSEIKQEDLQIHDRKPILLIEIKGLGGLPTESDCNQVIKYVHRRRNEWKHVDVKGISMINHQRNLPPLKRQKAFTTQQINDSKSQETLLLTNWDLFCLIKGFIEWKWNPRYIQERFYENGEFIVIPTHYFLVGEIFNYWEEPGAYGLKITEDMKLNTRDRLGYKLENEFLEEEITSLQRANKVIDKAVKGDEVGIKTIYSKSKLKKGTKIYKILIES